MKDTVSEFIDNCDNNIESFIDQLLDIEAKFNEKYKDLIKSLYDEFGNDLDNKIESLGWIQDSHSLIKRIIHIDPSEEKLYCIPIIHWFLQGTIQPEHFGVLGSVLLKKFESKNKDEA